MICQLPANILHQIAITKLSSEPDNSTSWFVNLRHLCNLYGLPSSLSLLASPPSKGCFKNLVNCQVIDHWKKHYEDEAAEKVSLKLSLSSLVVDMSLTTILDTGLKTTRRASVCSVQAVTSLVLLNIC